VVGNNHPFNSELYSTTVGEFVKKDQGIGVAWVVF